MKQHSSTHHGYLYHICEHHLQQHPLILTPTRLNRNVVPFHLTLVVSYTSDLLAAPKITQILCETNRTTLQEFRPHVATVLGNPSATISAIHTLAPRRLNQGHGTVINNGTQTPPANHGPWIALFILIVAQADHHRPWRQIGNLMNIHLDSPLPLGNSISQIALLTVQHTRNILLTLRTLLTFNPICPPLLLPTTGHLGSPMPGRISSRLPADNLSLKLLLHLKSTTHWFPFMDWRKPII